MDETSYALIMLIFLAIGLGHPVIGTLLIAVWLFKEVVLDD